MKISYLNSNIHLKAIDDVYMSANSCPQPADCDFEDDEFTLCTWLNVNREAKPPRVRYQPSVNSKLTNGTLVSITCKGNNKYGNIIFQLLKNFILFAKKNNIS